MWLNLLTLLLVSAASMQSPVCSIDKPGVSKLRSYEMVFQKMEPCFRSVVTEDMILSMRDTKSDGIRNLFKKFCPRHREVTSCMADVRSSLSLCQNKNISVPFMILSHLGEHLLTSGCEQDGERLAVMVRGYMALKEHRRELMTLRNCFYKTVSVFTLTDDAEIDLTSESYMTYKEMPMLKRCLKHVRNPEFNKTMEWWIDEAIASFRCLDPTDDTLIPCSAMNESLVEMSNVCELRPHDPALLYDQLENEAIDCFSFVHSHELRVGTNYSNLAWLTEDYRRMCQIHRVSLDCLLEKAGFAEACLATAEDTQFQLFMDSLDDVIHLGCQQDGRKVARIMLEVYRLKGSPNSNITDCFKNIMANRGNQTINKNLRFYKDMMAFKDCVVEELKENERISLEAAEIIGNIMGRIKCVRPEDGKIALCKTMR